jgi:hypothetical protein
MITVDVSERITVAEALKHDWFKEMLRASMQAK